jgi:hypothetical protein
LNLEEWLAQDRQWTRPLRLAHARFRLETATTDPDRKFWQQVIEANGDRPTKKAA